MEKDWGGTQKLKLNIKFVDSLIYICDKCFCEFYNQKDLFFPFLVKDHVVHEKQQYYYVTEKILPLQILSLQIFTTPEKSPPWEVRDRVRVRLGPGFFFRGDFFLEPFLQIMLSFFRNVMLLLANIMLTFCKYNTTF